MIPIHNIYYMLSYAFQILQEQGYKSIQTEEFDNVADLCAEILQRGFSVQIKRGLQREYLRYQEPLSSPKGKIEITESIKSLSILDKKLVCTYDDFSINSYMNRIIKTTMQLLIHADISKERKRGLKKLLVYLGDVEKLNPYHINWKLQYNRSNKTYRMLISICFFVIKGLLQTHSDGTMRVMDFLDEKRMSALYERFILEYYRRNHPELKPSAMRINWNIEGDADDILPVMRTDITLKSDDKTLILDAKYYSNPTIVHQGKRILHSANLYQIYAYVKNYDTEKSGNVSGLLMYAKTDTDMEINNVYMMDNNRIGAKTLDLNLPWEEIVKQLEELVVEYFSEVA